jgi:hypothetical protein
VLLPSHGENRGSIPLGSANDFKDSRENDTSSVQFQSSPCVITATKKAPLTSLLLGVWRGDLGLSLRRKARLSSFSASGHDRKPLSQSEANRQGCNEGKRKQAATALAPIG